MKTNPNIPNGAKLITHFTACVTASEISAKNSFVLSEDFLNAKPNTTAQANIPT